MNADGFDPLTHLHADPSEPVAAVLEERESAHGWVFTLALKHKRADRDQFELSVAWVDHDFYTGGGLEPSKLATVITEIAADVLGDELPARADAAMFRRRIPGFDNTVHDRLATAR
ncbi:MAG: hypothetical protein AAGA55_07400 [Planctomycetota bacterium]